MFARELFTVDSTAVVAFGRFQPPTVGHLSLIETMRSLKGDHYLFLSHTQNSKTDPLDFNTKKKFVESCFPNITIGNQNVKTIIQALQLVESKGYKNLIYVAGSDRVESFRSLIEKYNGKEYNFKTVNVVSAGDRDPDADGVAGVSASKLREAVVADDFEYFKKNIPNANIAEEMFGILKGALVENFADGKVKGKSRPGRVKQSGASCNGSVTDLRKRAKNSSGEKSKMYHWCANMKSGKKKNG